MKLGGALQFGDGYTDVNGGIGFGKERGLFFGVGAGISSPRHGDSNLEVLAHVGKELSEPVGGKFELCPIVNLLLGFPSESKYQHLLAGIAGGYPVTMSSENMGLILTGLFQLGFSHFSVSDCDLEACSGTDFVGVLGGGVGLIFNNRISLNPAILIGFGGGNSDVAFRAAVSIALGKKS